LWRAVFDMNKNPLPCISIHVTGRPCQAGNRGGVTTGSTEEHGRIQGKIGYPVPSV
jgi:hypothetical protein